MKDVSTAPCKQEVDGAAVLMGCQQQQLALAPRDEGRVRMGGQQQQLALAHEIQAASIGAYVANRRRTGGCLGVPWTASQMPASAPCTGVWLSRLLELLVLADAAQELHVVGEPCNLRQLRTGTLRTWLVRRRRPVAHGWLVFMNRFVNHKQVGAQMATPVRPAVTLHWAQEGDPTHLQLPQRGVQAGQGGGAVGAVAHQLGNHGVIECAHL